MVVFMKRNCGEFTYQICLKILYCSLICSIVEYESIVWNPYVTGNITKIDNVQKRFLLRICYKLREIDTPTNTFARKLNLQSLEDRRFNNHIFFSLKIKKQFN